MPTLIDAVFYPNKPLLKQNSGHQHVLAFEPASYHKWYQGAFFEQVALLEQSDLKTTPIAVEVSCCELQDFRINPLVSPKL